MRDVRETMRHATLLTGQVAAYVGIVALLDVARPASVPFLALPLVAVVIIHVTVFPRAFISILDCEVVTPDTRPRLHAHVERLAQQANIKPPRVAIRDASEANAIVTGIAGANGTIVLNSTLVERLEPRELDGVLAHEIAHLAHHDAPKSMALAMVALYGVGSLPPLVASALHLSDFFRATVTVICIFGGCVSVLAYIRRNEYRADATAAHLLGTGTPLADALVKTSTPHRRLSARDLLATASPSSGGLSPSLTALLTTHPKLSHRIERLLADDTASN